MILINLSISIRFLLSCQYLKNISKKYLGLLSPGLLARLVVDTHILIHASTIVIFGFFILYRSHFTNLSIN